MVMHRHAQHALGMALADHVIVQHFAYLTRRRHPIARLYEMGFVLFANDVHAEFDTFIANEHGRARNQFTDLMLRLTAKRTI